MTNPESFTRLYASIHEAGDKVSALTDAKGQMNPRVTRDDITKINRLLRLAVGAALALESRLAGNPEPKEG